MSFVADKQTLDDLNILGKYKGDSIINLFNYTYTQGGARLLESMFQHPLADAAAINARSSIMQYFQDAGRTFPVTRELCDQVEHYLSAAGSNSLPGTALIIGRKKLLRVIGASPEYDMMHTVLLSVIEFVRVLRDFFAQLKGLYQETFQEVQQLFDLLKAHEGTRLSFWKTIQFDYQLRHNFQPQLRRILEVLYKIDVYITVSKIARERKFIWPTAIPFVEGSNRIEIDHVFHPRVRGAVANNVYTDHMNNMLFLTGANMAGKSTFMKSVGIALYLAHMGFPVAAERMVFSVQDGLFTSINVSDNLDMGYSHFYAEVLRVKEVAVAVSRSQNLVVIFDELFKGTNVKDAYDATVAVTAAFAENRNATFIVSTHIVEAGQTLQLQHANINFVYFPTIMDNGIPQYTYKLQDGISNDRHGMRIITNEGIVDIIRGKKA
jgi:DNA mismatch repair protein MutS